MSAVTKQEIVAMIEGIIESDACMGSISDKQAITALELVNRIKQHGIAPPDGMVLVSVATLRWWAELAQINPKDLPPRIEAMLAAAEREQHNGPCALQHNTNWKKGAEGHVYLATNFSCSACGYVGLHDAMPTCRRAIRARGNGGGK